MDNEDNVNDFVFSIFCIFKVKKRYLVPFPTQRSQKNLFKIDVNLKASFK